MKKTIVFLITIITLFSITSLPSSHAMFDAIFDEFINDYFEDPIVLELLKQEKIIEALSIVETSCP